MGLKGSKHGKPYSGNPEDYLNLFMAVVESFPIWKPDEQAWVKKEISSKGMDKGIADITTALVGDKELDRTNHFKAAERKEIVDCLLNNEAYMAAAWTHFGGPTDSLPSPGQPYSGNPEDYVSLFKALVDCIPSWPSKDQAWVKGEISSKGMEQGIVDITTEIVMDTAKEIDRTKNFKPEEKKDIVDCLLKNEVYMAAAQKHFGGPLDCD